jgi:hypothetical protein
MFEQDVQRLHIPAGKSRDVVLERIGRDSHDFMVLAAREKSHLFSNVAMLKPRVPPKKTPGRSTAAPAPQ